MDSAGSPPPPPAQEMRTKRRQDSPDAFVQGLSALADFAANQPKKTHRPLVYDNKPFGALLVLALAGSVVALVFGIRFFVKDKQRSTEWTNSHYDPWFERNLCTTCVTTKVKAKCGVRTCTRYKNLCSSWKNGTDSAGCCPEVGKYKSDCRLPYDGVPKPTSLYPPGVGLTASGAVILFIGSAFLIMCLAMSAD
eukprot:TRINITY_DN97198_c0_g1_i1.p1 TRINITY_DN97198_c0_g1~~TRINITY_DN97198_c0_g1_i1.p1  ORF type:complete len:194 (+),score=18.16 TRINITY_DN97198_c0_g1_i1:53-634(+)